MPDFVLDDMPIHYGDRGALDTPPVVLLHGLNHDHRVWQPLAQELERAYRVVTPDLHGHGRSGGGDDAARYALDRQARDILALLDSLGIELFALAGVEFGGAIAMRLAALAPERIAALMLIETAGQFTGASSLPPEVADLAWRFGPRGAARRLAARLEDEHLQGALSSVLARTRADAYAASIEAWRAGPASPDALVGRLSCPLLLVSGAGSPFAGALEAMHAAFPAARAATVRGASGDVLGSHPELVSEVVRAFLHDVEAGRPVGGSLQV